MEESNRFETPQDSFTVSRSEAEEMIRLRRDERFGPEAPMSLGEVALKLGISELEAFEILTRLRKDKSKMVGLQQLGLNREKRIVALAGLGSLLVLATLGTWLTVGRHAHQLFSRRPSPPILRPSVVRTAHEPQYVYMLSIRLDDLKDPVQVSILMSDLGGSREIYSKTEEPGALIEKVANGSGDNATFQICFDGKPVEVKEYHKGRLIRTENSMDRDVDPKV